MIVTSFNTSLLAGANFTASTTNGNTVAFTMSTLTPGKRYFVNVGDATVDSPVADSSGMIKFSYSNWLAGVFMVVEDASYVPTQSSGNATGKSIYKNQTALSAANVTVNGDNKVDVLDLNMMAQRFNEKTGTAYPAVDVNGDGVVDVYDLMQVSGQIEKQV